MSQDSEYWEDQANQARAEAQDWQEKYEALRTDFDTLMEGLREIEQAISGVRGELSKELARLAESRAETHPKAHSEPRPAT